MTPWIVRDGLFFGEGPRWHDGRLWYSDFFDGAVHAVTLEGEDERILEVPGQPSGLGWLPDGSLLVVSRHHRKLLRWDGATLAEHADIGPYAGFHANDLVVDARGRAYVGNFGFDLDGFLAQHGYEGVYGEPGPPTTVLCRVDLDGSISVVADELVFPNGTVLTPDGGTLIIGETLALRLTAFDVAEDGSLSNRRVWADLSAVGCAPDGICLDAEGAVWVATAATPQCLRVVEGGDVIDQFETTQIPFACMLGGPEGRHLFAITAPSFNAEKAAASPRGRIEATVVPVPHAGLP